MATSSGVGWGRGRWRRLQEFPRCARGMREGRLSLDQVGVIADRAGEGSDAHYAELAGVATVNQLRSAVKLEPPPEPEPESEPDSRAEPAGGSPCRKSMRRSLRRRCSRIWMR